ncbi:MAG: hypothetical protein ABIP71_14870 [Verrucomicrobiota bacterium]
MHKKFNPLCDYIFGAARNKQLKIRQRISDQRLHSRDRQETNINDLTITNSALLSRP